MTKNLIERLEDAAVHINAGAAQSVSEPVVPVLSILEPVVKSESFSKWLKRKKDDMKEVRHLVKTRANNLQKGLYLTGRVLGYALYVGTGYGVYQIIERLGN